MDTIRCLIVVKDSPRVFSFSSIRCLLISASDKPVRVDSMIINDRYYTKQLL